MKNLIKNKISLLIVLTILLLIVAGVFFYLMPKKQMENSRPEDFKVTTEEVKGVQTLQGFPVNLPVEAGSIDLQNYESTSNDGRIQSTKKFTTELTITEATQKYVEFFKKLGWQVTAKTTSPVLLVRKNDALKIEVTKSSEKNAKSVVEITLVQNKN